ncbi:MAG: flavin reductase [Oscillospiraceae bacterium]|nr:flavin reductase [Oscillospiraceae bacterium]
MKDFITKSFNIFDKEWALVTAGTTDNYNTMTISWGGLGTIWNKPVATVYVKPVRYTHSFLDSNEYFTVSFYDEKYRKDLGVLGTLSGRDGDKVAKTALTPVTVGESISFKEAKMTLLCKKIYRQDLITDTMPQEAIDKYYIDEAPHTMFIGEVVNIIE